MRDAAKKNVLKASLVNKNVLVGRVTSFYSNEICCVCFARNLLSIFLLFTFTIVAANPSPPQKKRCQFSAEKTQPGARGDKYGRRDSFAAAGKDTRNAGKKNLVKIGPQDKILTPPVAKIRFEHAKKFFACFVFHREPRARLQIRAQTYS